MRLSRTLTISQCLLVVLASVTFKSRRRWQYLKYEHLADAARSMEHVRG